MRRANSETGKSINTLNQKTHGSNWIAWASGTIRQVVQANSTERLLSTIKDSNQYHATECSLDKLRIRA